MMVPKLLHVVVQPVFVLVDPETCDVKPGPQVSPSTIPADLIKDLPDLIDNAKQQIAEQLIE